jgi:hypothetical protein
MGLSVSTIALVRSGRSNAPIAYRAAGEVELARLAGVDEGDALVTVLASPRIDRVRAVKRPAERGPAVDSAARRVGSNFGHSTAGARVTMIAAARAIIGSRINVSSVAS